MGLVHPSPTCFVRSRALIRISNMFSIETSAVALTASLSEDFLLARVSAFERAQSSVTSTMFMFVTYFGIDFRFDTRLTTVFHRKATYIFSSPRPMNMGSRPPRSMAYSPAHFPFGNTTANALACRYRERHPPTTSLILESNEQTIVKGPDNSARGPRCGLPGLRSLCPTQVCGYLNMLAMAVTT